MRNPYHKLIFYHLNYTEAEAHRFSEYIALATLKKGEERDGLLSSSLSREIWAALDPPTPSRLPYQQETPRTGGML